MNYYLPVGKEDKWKIGNCWDITPKYLMKYLLCLILTAPTCVNEFIRTRGLGPSNFWCTFSQDSRDTALTLSHKLAILHSQKHIYTNRTCHFLHSKKFGLRSFIIMLVYRLSNLVHVFTHSTAKYTLES